MERSKTIAFYATILATFGVAMLGPTLGGLLPDGPVYIPLDLGPVEGKELAGGLWFGGLMLGALTAAALLLSSSEDNFRRLANHSSKPPG